MKRALLATGLLWALGSCKDATPEPAPPPVTASFTAPVSVLLSAFIQFHNTSQNADSYQWNFGNGQTSTDISPVYHYSYPGSYTVTLAAYDKQQKVARYSQSIQVTDTYVAPLVAKFDLPGDAAETLPTTFLNKSQGSFKFKWSFGDGATAATTSPTHIYATQGTYTVTLRIYGTHQDSALVSQVLTVAPNVIARAPIKIPGTYNYFLVKQQYRGIPSVLTTIRSSGILKVTQSGAATILIPKVDTLTSFVYTPDPATPTIYPFKFRESYGVYTLYGTALFYPTGDSLHMSLTTHIGLGGTDEDTYRCYRRPN